MSLIEFHNAAEFRAYRGHATSGDTVVFDYAVRLSDHSFAKIAAAKVVLANNGVDANVIRVGTESAAASSHVEILASHSQLTLLGPAGTGLDYFDVLGVGAGSKINMHVQGTIVFDDGSQLGSSIVKGAGGALQVFGTVAASDFLGVHGGYGAPGIGGHDHGSLEIGAMANVSLNNAAVFHLGASATNPLQIVSMIGGHDTVDASAMTWGVSVLNHNTNDVFIAGHGNDTINSFGGTVTGGAGNDLFIFNVVGTDALTITDFTPGHDRVDLHPYTAYVANFDALKANATDLGGTAGVHVAIGTAHLTLGNTTIAQLHASDFIF